MVFSYCERIEPGLFAEPANAITNLAFLFSAGAAYRFARQVGGASMQVSVLALISILIGIGSAVFHTVATEWARWLDFLPILIFEICFFCFYLDRRGGLVLSGTVLLLVALIDGAAQGALNGSAVYLPSFLALVGLGLQQRSRGSPEPYSLLTAAAVFSLSLLFRSIDRTACDVISLGTHFLWHVLNGFVLYLLMRSVAIMQSVPAAAFRESRNG